MLEVQLTTKEVTEVETGSPLCDICIAILIEIETTLLINPPRPWNGIELVRTPPRPGIVSCKLCHGI